MRWSFRQTYFSLEKKGVKKKKRKETSILFQKKKKLARSYRVSPAVYIITVKLYDDDGSNGSSSSVGLLFLSFCLIFCCCYFCYRRNSLEKNSQCICMLTREMLQTTTMLSSFGWATKTILILPSNISLSLPFSLLVIEYRVIFALSRESRNSRVSVSI